MEGDRDMMSEAIEDYALIETDGDHVVLAVFMEEGFSGDAETVYLDRDFPMMLSIGEKRYRVPAFPEEKLSMLAASAAESRADIVRISPLNSLLCEALPLRIR